MNLSKVLLAALYILFSERIILFLLAAVTIAFYIFTTYPVVNKTTLAYFYLFAGWLITPVAFSKYLEKITFRTKQGIYLILKNYLFRYTILSLIFSLPVILSGFFVMTAGKDPENAHFVVNAVTSSIELFVMPFLFLGNSIKHSILKGFAFLWENRQIIYKLILVNVFLCLLAYSLSTNLQVGPDIDLIKSSFSAILSITLLFCEYMLFIAASIYICALERIEGSGNSDNTGKQ